MTTQWFDAVGVSLSYAVVGEGERTLVFIHELGGSLHSWDALVGAFSQHYRCLRYDQRGAGDSEKVRRAYGVAQQVDDLCALLAHCAATEHVPDIAAATAPAMADAVAAYRPAAAAAAESASVGASSDAAVGIPSAYVLVSAAAGATVALAYAARYPETVAALVLCAPATGVSADRRAYLDARSTLAMEQGMRAIAEATLARSYPPQTMRDAAVYQRYRARFLANDALEYALANRALMAFELDEVITAISMPCLLLAGAHDVLRPVAEVAALAQRLPRATLAEIDAGHLMAVQNPAAVAAAIRRFFADSGLAPGR